MSEYLRLFEAELAEERVRIFRGDDPGAGADVSVTVPGGVLWQLYTVLLMLVTDATVANRTATLVIDDGTTEFFRADPIQSMAASTTRRFQWSAGGDTRNAVNNSMEMALPSPPLVLRPGCRIRTATGSFQAGDNYAAPAFYVIETVMRSPQAQAVYEQRLRRRAERLAGELGETRAP